MAYQIKRKPHVQETLELCDQEGNVKLRIDVDIDVDKMGGRIAAAQSVMGAAQKLIAEQPNSDAAQEAFGKSVVALFTTVFGEDDTGKILTFYEGNYAEMLLDVFPFLNEAVLPAVAKASADRKNQLLAAANAGRRK